MFELTVTRGPDQGRKVQLREGRTYKVGSSPDDSLVLTDPKVLDGHCSLAVSASQVLLTNHTASAGTYIGDQKIAKARLASNSSFRIGDSVLTLTAVRRRRAVNQDDPLVGKIIGGYKLNEVVGSGGMGTVYKATQLSLHRDVAVKVLKSSLANDKAFRDLFIHEARSAAQLVDPNVVQVYDAGRDGDVSYFSMEFMGLGTVEDRLDVEGKIEWPEAILMVLEAAHGLLYAESRGIVHRDIKPDNLMINDDGRIKLADLGLAKRGDTKDEGISGTPHFIPPEQALGKEVDTRADIYSLGATFFRLISGKTLFTGKTAKEIVLKHIKEPPPAASSVEESVPDDLDAVIAKMLAKQPDQRYQTARELISALEEVCAHHGIKGAIIRKGVGKRVLIPVLVLLIAAVGVAAWQLSKDPETIVEFDPAEIERRKKAEEAAAKARREREAALLKGRQANAERALEGLKNDELKLRLREPPSRVYVDTKKRGGRESEWITMANRFEAFAKGKDAIEFHLAVESQGRADKIRKELQRYEASAADQREKIAAKVKEAKKIYADQRVALGELLRERHYGDAYNRCEFLKQDEVEEGHAFHPIVNWVWVSPADQDIIMPAMESDEIEAVVNKAREYFGDEKKLILTRAQNDWISVRTKAGALTEDATEEQMQSVIDALREVETRFPAARGPQVPEIEAIVTEARKRRSALQEELNKIRVKRLRADREIVKDTLRKVRSLDPDVIPNLVMNCEIGAAIDWWNKLLVDGQIQTAAYRGFVKERIGMLRWIDYLFARFHADVKASVSDKKNPPLRSLDFELPDPDGGKPIERKFTDPGGNIYAFSFNRAVKGDKDRKFGAMTMDWVYHDCFLDKGQLRWANAQQPVLRFALGVFCFETMQFKEAEDNLQVLAANERYGAAAQALLKRTRLERAALEDYMAILRAIPKATTVKEIRDIEAMLAEFPQKHQGTLVFVDVMKHNEEIRKDISQHTIADLPKAPPRPPE